MAARGGRPGSTVVYVVIATPPDGTQLEARQVRAGAVMADRGGQAVAVHYGSVAAEVAVCLKSVGLAVRSDLRTLELAGHQAWLDGLLERGLGAGVPVGRAENLGGSWCARVGDRSALVVGPPDGVARWARLARDAVVTGSVVALLDQTASFLTLSLIGPRVPALLAAAGLPPAATARLVRRASLAGCPAVLVGEADDCVLLLVKAEGAASACQALFEVGPAVGLSLVGAEAIGRLDVARRRHA
jgi:glycine cleavage system aminomethyltransferase T